MSSRHRRALTGRQKQPAWHQVGALAFGRGPLRGGQRSASWKFAGPSRGAESSLPYISAGSAPPGRPAASRRWQLVHGRACFSFTDRRAQSATRARREQPMGGRRRAGQSRTPPAHSAPRLAAASCSGPQARRRAGGGAVSCHALFAWPLVGCLRAPPPLLPPPPPCWGAPFANPTPPGARFLVAAVTQ